MTSPLVSLTVEQALQLAWTHHAAGRAREAEGICRQVLQARPDNPDALHLLSQIALGARHPDALTLVDRALEIRPGSAVFHVSRGKVLAALGQDNEALECYKRAIAIAPARADAWANMGQCLARLGQTDRAVEAFDEAVRADPAVAESHYNLAMALQTLGRFAEAANAYKKAIEVRPGFPEAHNNLGNVYRELDADEAAIQSYRQALTHNPGLVQAHFNLAQLQRERRNTPAAVESYRRVLALDPKHVDAAYNLGVLFGEEGELHNRRHDFLQAERFLRQAIALDPSHFRAFNNLGAVLYCLGDVPGANAFYERALALRPTDIHARKNLSHGYLVTGRFAEGWAHYAWRGGDPGEMPEARWLLEHSAPSAYLPSLQGRLELRAEQGFGDILFFLRFAPELKRRGLALSLRVEPRLHGMLQRTGLFDELLSPSQAQPDADAVIRIGDLPALFGVDAAAKVPGPLPLRPEANLVEMLARRLADLGPPPYIGVTWRAGLAPMLGKETLFKEIPLEELAKAISSASGTLISIQRNPEAGETERLSKLTGKAVHDWSKTNDDLEAALALMSLLDDYVGVSNTNMHIRAGLGKPARVLLQWPPDWRWQLAGDASPWFPSFKIYRAEPVAGWDAAATALRRDLAGGSAIDTVHSGAAQSPAVERPVSRTENIRDALAHLRAGEIDAADAVCSTLIQSDDRNADAHHLKAVTGWLQNNPDAAAISAERAIALAPARGDYHLTLGRIRKAQGKFEDAIQCLREAVQLSPTSVEAQNSYGVLSEEMNRIDDAIDAYTAALALDPGFAMAEYNLGNAMLKKGRAADAALHYKRAIAIDPGLMLAYHNLGRAMIAVGQAEAAIEAHGRAIQLDPGYAPAREALSHIALLKGNFEEGWREYRWRSARISVERTLESLDSLAPDFADRTFVVQAEQGIGDILFFARFAPALAKAGARLVYWGDARIAELLRGQNCFVEYFHADESPPESVPRILIGDLPFILLTHSVRDLPGPVMLKVDAEKIRKARATLQSLGPAPYIGITWRAGTRDPAVSHALYKEISIDELAGALREVPGTFISLQRNPTDGETSRFESIAGRKAHDFSALNANLEEMAAMLSVLDDYVGVSNTNMHLRAGVGKTARVLVPLPPEWRWMLSGTTSPWFPGFEVYRQTPLGDWSEALNMLQADLQPSVIQREEI